jgi:cold shock CspA family protein
MAKSQVSSTKKEKETKRLKKIKDKQQRSEDRKKNSVGGALEDMFAYVDEYGNLTDTPPDPTKKKIVVDVNSIVLGVRKREDEETSPIKKGKVEFYNDSKGFGFIKELDTQEKYFVHVNGLIDPIKENDMVTFELERGLKGMNAVRVTKTKA